MTTKTENGDRLLSSEERAIFSQVASMEPPYSQRAQALLAIDEGATQAEAGVQAGLTKGQVRYWLGKFRKEGTSIFPEESLSQTQPQDADLPQSDVPDLEQAAGEEEPTRQEDAPKVKKKSKKKSKKAGKSKKGKKSKKDKKKKKGEKSKKKAKKKGSKKGKGAEGKSSKKNKKKRKK